MADATTTDVGKLVAGIPALDHHPDFAPSVAKLHELRARRSELLAHLEGANNELATEARKTTADHAAALLAGTGTSAPTLPVLDIQQKRIRDEITIVDEAIRMHTRNMQSLRAQLGRKVAEGVAAAHKANVRRALAAAVALAEAGQFEEDLVAALEHRDYPVGGVLRRVVPGNLGRVDDHESEIAAALREAVEYGQIDRADPLLKLVNAIQGHETCLPENARAAAELEAKRVAADRRNRFGPEGAERERLREAAKKKGPIRRLMESIGVGPDGWKARAPAEASV